MTGTIAVHHKDSRCFDAALGHVADELRAVG